MKHCIKLNTIIAAALLLSAFCIQDCHAVIQSDYDDDFWESLLPDKNETDDSSEDDILSQMLLPDAHPWTDNDYKDYRLSKYIEFKGYEMIAFMIIAMLFIIAWIWTSYIKRPAKMAETPELPDDLIRRKDIVGTRVILDQELLRDKYEYYGPDNCVEFLEWAARKTVRSEELDREGRESMLDQIYYGWIVTLADFDVNYEFLKKKNYRDSDAREIVDRIRDEINTEENILTLPRKKIISDEDEDVIIQRESQIPDFTPEQLENEMEIPAIMDDPDVAELPKGDYFPDDCGTQDEPLRKKYPDAPEDDTEEFIVWVLEIINDRDEDIRKDILLRLEWGWIHDLNTFDTYYQDSIEKSNRKKQFENALKLFNEKHPDNQQELSSEIEHVPNFI